MLYTSNWSKFELTTSVVIGTDCIGSCKSNYHTITAMTAPIDNHTQSGVTCPPTDCCLVEWHVHPQTVVSVNQDNMTEWSDMSTHRLLFQWIRITLKQQSVGGHVTPLSHIILIHWKNSLWVDMSLHSVILSWFTETTVCGWTCYSTQSYYPDSLKQQLTCPPTVCCLVEWHVHPQTVVSVNQDNMTQSNRVSNRVSTALEATTLTITQLI
jgi:hypothetical protein